MPNFVVIRVSDVPDVGVDASATVRIENAATDVIAAQQALAAWAQTNVVSGVIAVVAAANVTRRTFVVNPATYTVT